MRDIEEKPEGGLIMDTIIQCTTICIVVVCYTVMKIYDKRLLSKRIDAEYAIKKMSVESNSTKVEGV